SGNCIRNVTTDPYAGAAADEIEDPRIWAEVLRQWSTVHPEFTFLPRKFKIAITGAAEDRTATLFHDIGLRIVKAPGGRLGFRVLVGGGQGRTPCIAEEIARFVPQEHLLSYLEAILRVYNLHGRRDNIYKARIKILVSALGIDEMRRQVEAEWEKLDKAAIDLPSAELARIRSRFALLPLQPVAPTNKAIEGRRREDAGFDRWLRHNVVAHRVPGHAIVNISLKEPGLVPGDASADQMDVVADLAVRYGHDEVRVTYQQNLVLPHVARADLAEVYDALRAAGLAADNIGGLTDIIACPGLDYCNLANARSIPIAQDIARRFADPARSDEIGPLRLNISGCINACGHHHVAAIGILGVDKKGTEHYQITLGGHAGEDAAIGDIIGPSFAADAVADAIACIVDTYLALRANPAETFLDAYRRLGLEPFRRALYGAGRPSAARQSQPRLESEHV
ncbi:MAG: nitrite/sulfite reductase, partial [Hyphomicrobiaceae bacterium]|nr:nitrite/sulfite reductase [Hyphomicrobiaceae bacterium]